MRRLCFVLLFTVGCASSVGTGGARVLDAGRQELGFAADLTFPAAQIGPSAPTRGIWPQIGAGYRRGFEHGFEAGARVWGFGLPASLYTFGAGVDLRYGIIRADDPNEDFDLTLGLGGAYHQVNAGGAPTHVWIIQAPLLFGANIGDGNQIFFGPRFENHHITGADLNPVNVPLFGGSLGFAWRALEWIEIRPEVVLLLSPVPFNGTADDPDRRGLGILQFGFSNAIFLEKL